MARGPAPHNVILHVCSIWCSFASEVFPIVDIPSYLAVTDRKKLADCLCECVFARLQVALRRRRKGCRLWNTIDVCLKNLLEWVFLTLQKAAVSVLMWTDLFACLECPGVLCGSNATHPTNMQLLFYVCYPPIWPKFSLCLFTKMMVLLLLFWPCKGLPFFLRVVNIVTCINGFANIFVTLVLHRIFVKVRKLALALFNGI